MRPILMLENVKTLHDARYCAAVGIGMLSFDLDQDSGNAMPLSAAVEIAQWLMGVDCVAKLGTMASPLYDIVAQDASFSHVLFPFRDYAHGGVQSVLLEIMPDECEEALLKKMHAVVESNPNARFLLPSEAEVFLRLSTDPQLLERCVFRFNDPSEFLQRIAVASPLGFSFGTFAFDADGELDYDACDRFIDTYNSLSVNESAV